MHPAEYERYLSLKAGQSQKPATSQAELDVQQSVVSTIKSKYRLKFQEFHNLKMKWIKFTFRLGSNLTV